MNKLPHPVHAQDEYAHAIVLELRAINAELQKLNAAIEGLAEKPKAATPRKRAPAKKDD